MRSLPLLLLLFMFSTILRAQETSLLDLVGEEKPGRQYAKNAFKSSRVIMSHSMEHIAPGAMDFRILHRFGVLSNGVYEMFGLDQATIRFSFDFGITPNLMVGIGRASYKKEFDAFAKYRIMWQQTGEKNRPFSLLYVVGTTISTLKPGATEPQPYFSSRMGYYHQLIIGRKFSNAFSLQLMPSIVHENLVEKASQLNDNIFAGVGTRIKLSQRVALTADYYYRFTPKPAAGIFNPLSIGFDIETGGHVFQLHFTNARGMNERTFLNETSLDWKKGDIMFGFNLSRTFQVKERKVADI